ncbi:MAG: methyltransferase domain-containing protein [Terracidiphilus sp.]|jgi:ubiquinone/menaquinone biosynthesis C-methylase UbiE
MAAVVEPGKDDMHGRRFPASEAHRLDNPARKEWLSPTEVIRALALHSGETIADVGAGTGYFSLPLAQSVGPEGKVYAVDAQAEMLSLLRQKLAASAFANVELIHADAGQTGLPASSCDLFLLANIWHEIEDQIAVLREAIRVLKKSGRIAILDWRPDVEPEHGPPLAHRVDPSQAKESLSSEGFEHVEIANVGRYSWLVQGGKLP